MKTAREYYDAFAVRQLQAGVNARHRAIQKWLDDFGLRPGAKVLEIGCGIGTQTELIAQSLRGEGAIVAVDLSPRSIELARQRLRHHPEVAFVAGDVLEIELAGPFDVVVLPDVIEHIPIEHHRQLFQKVRGWLNTEGWVLIHIPNPFFLEWCRDHRPDLLQIIDQPIFLETLLENVKPSGFYVHYLNTYRIWVQECDYQVIVLKPRTEPMEFHFLSEPPPFAERLKATLRSAARRLRSLLR
jgi:trans-aconitate 2-methyltransferase